MTAPQVLFGAFLVVHGLIHLAWNAPKPDDPAYPFDLTRSPLLKKASPQLLKATGSTLVTLATVEFVAAGAALILLPGVPTLWRLLALIGALDSIAVIAIFWHRWFVVGLALDVAIIVAAAVSWPV